MREAAIATPAVSGADGAAGRCRPQARAVGHAARPDARPAWLVHGGASELAAAAVNPGIAFGSFAASAAVMPGLVIAATAQAATITGNK